MWREAAIIIVCRFKNWHMSCIVPRPWEGPCECVCIISVGKVSHIGFCRPAQGTCWAAELCVGTACCCNLKVNCVRFRAAHIEDRCNLKRNCCSLKWTSLCTIGCTTACDSVLNYWWAIMVSSRFQTLKIAAHRSQLTLSITSAIILFFAVSSSMVRCAYLLACSRRASLERRRQQRKRWVEGV